MRAAVYERYGPPEVISIRDVPTPAPADDEVLIRVHAASINSWDWDMIRGEPFFVRMWGLFRPRYRIPGADIAGVVVAVGKKVTRWKKGDEVLGDLCQNGWGGYAEYVTARESAIVAKPPTITFEEAASMPQAGLLALQSLYWRGELRPGQHVLINGAGGGVGTFAVQIARQRGMVVTGVDSADKLNLLLAMGADRVVDFNETDFASEGKRYDLIMDMVATRRLSVIDRCLNPGGRYARVGGTSPAILKAMLFGKRAKRPGEKSIGIMAHQPNFRLEELVSMVSSKQVNPVIDTVYDLRDIVEAFRQFSTGRFVGKIVIKVE